MKVAFLHVNVVFNVPNSLARHASSVKHANNHYWGLRPFTYRIVASTNTCYYSENQIFYSLE